VAEFGISSLFLCSFLTGIVLMLATPASTSAQARVALTDLMAARVLPLPFERSKGSLSSPRTRRSTLSPFQALPAPVLQSSSLGLYFSGPLFFWQNKNGKKWVSFNISFTPLWQFFRGFRLFRPSLIFIYQRTKH
jgi:hypothetical protein